MFLTVFVRGVLIGILASIPMGPIGVLCIQRTLSKNHKSGFISGVGAATSDTIYASIAFFSLKVVLSFIMDNITVIKALGGVCVILIGVYIFMTNPVVQIRKNRAGKTNLWQDFLSVLLITIANPTFILMFIGLFAAFGVSSEAVGMFNGLFIIAGVFAGCSLWWFSLTFIVNLFRKKFRPRHLFWINRISGSIIILLGLITFLLVFVNVPVDGLLR